MASPMAVICLLACAAIAIVDRATPQAMLDAALADLSAGRAAEAEAGLRRALSVAAPGSTDETDCWNALAWLLMDRGDIAGAERAASRALDTGERLYGKYHPKLVTSLNTLAEGRIVREEFSAAEELLRRATRLAARPGASPLLEPAVAVRRGLLWLATGRYAEAESALERSLELTEDAIGADHHAVRPLFQVLARCYRLRHRHADAATLEARAAALSAARRASLAQGDR